MELTATKLKDLKRETWFTRKPIEYPSDRQVFIKNDYDREDKRYICYRFSDVNDYIMLKGDTIVYTDFTF